MAEDNKDVPFTMSPEQLAAYREELQGELFELEHAQSLHPSDYKMERIKRIRQRLGIDTYI